MEGASWAVNGAVRKRFQITIVQQRIARLPANVLQKENSALLAKSLGRFSNYSLASLTLLLTTAAFAFAFYRCQVNHRISLAKLAKLKVEYEERLDREVTAMGRIMRIEQVLRDYQWFDEAAVPQQMNVELVGVIFELSQNREIIDSSPDFDEDTLDFGIKALEALGCPDLPTFISKAMTLGFSQENLPSSFQSSLHSFVDDCFRRKKESK